MIGGACDGITDVFELPFLAGTSRPSWSSRAAVGRGPWPCERLLQECLRFDRTRPWAAGDDRPLWDASGLRRVLSE